MNTLLSMTELAASIAGDAADEFSQVALCADGQPSNYAARSGREGNELAAPVVEVLEGGSAERNGFERTLAYPPMVRRLCRDVENLSACSSGFCRTAHQVRDRSSASSSAT